ncbi:MAG: FTR1 family protein [Anaerolineae bacterium]|nr:FTR1 family protein [Anaerolineae bacterium]
MKQIRLIIGVLVMSAFLIFPALAQESPAATAEDVRQLLFEAQSALMGGDSVGAAQAVQDAETIYTNTLRPPIAAVAPEIAEMLDANFASALAAAESGEANSLAALRGRIWADLLGGGTALTLNALENGDAGTARHWLLLREFRASTRFSRPNADATLAIDGLLRGQGDVRAALESVEADLFDTYQAQLNGALSDADQANARGYAMKRAEEAGLAAGYFEILAGAYGEQRGDDALSSARAAFAALIDAATDSSKSAFELARADVDAALRGFRAAPLSDAELARRAGQLTRFISLVPVEYERGVRDGRITSDLEIQEANTFRDGAAAAFADLQPMLDAIDATTTTQVAELLETVKTQIAAVATPEDLRTTVETISRTLDGLMPEAWKAANSDSDMDVILSVLQQVENAAAQGQYALAESARLEAYALLELGMEQKLLGYAPDLALRIESAFWAGDARQAGLATLLATHAPMGEIRASLGVLRAALAEAQAALSNIKSAPGAVAGNAAVIIFREGLEAVLILASLLASLRTAEELRYRRPIIIGAGLAFLATGLTWVAANALLTTLLPLGERLEAIVSLIAIGVLLLITNWFFHKVYWTGWMANFHSQKRRLIGGTRMVALSQMIGLVVLGFTSIYREGFESVLFLQSLVLEAGIFVVLRGVTLGLIGVAIVGFITFKLQVRLPYKKMLVVTGVMIGAVLLIMVGHTVHVMQAVGWLPITPIAGVDIPLWMGQWFGLFATWQGVGLQIASAVFVIGSYFWAERINIQKRRREVPANAAASGAGD